MQMRYCFYTESINEMVILSNLHLDIILPVSLSNFALLIEIEKKNATKSKQNTLLSPSKIQW